MHESATHVDGESTRKPAASREAVDGHVFTQCWPLVREQAVEATKRSQVKAWTPHPRNWEMKAPSNIGAPLRDFL
jgi:hypothetical protein